MRMVSNTARGTVVATLVLIAAAAPIQSAGAAKGGTTGQQTIATLSDALPWSYSESTDRFTDRRTYSAMKTAAKDAEHIAAISIDCDEDKPPSLYLSFTDRTFHVEKMDAALDWRVDKAPASKMHGRYLNNVLTIPLRPEETARVILSELLSGTNVITAVTAARLEETWSFNLVEGKDAVEKVASKCGLDLHRTTTPVPSAP